MSLYLLTNARLIDPEAGTESRGDVRIEGQTIAQIAPGLEARTGERVVDCGGLCVAPAIVDLGVKTCEPGERQKESLRSAALAAAAGGVGTMVTRADTLPAIDSPESLEFITKRAESVSAVRVAPMAALTRGRAGREICELGFLRDGGAVAFGDGPGVLPAVPDLRLLARAYRYASSLGALVIGHPQEPALSANGCATSGKFATLKGLPPVPAMAERMGLERDLALAEMTGLRYHADQITTAAALAPLRRARGQGLDVSAGVSVHHVTLNEFDIGPYRSFFKLTPPLRSETDRGAVAQALADGEIDVLCSMHTPQDEESKRLPFEGAAPGAVGLETLLPAALRLVHGGVMGLPALFQRLSLAPARRLGLPQGRLAPGAPADLVVFNPDTPFILDRATLHSKSKNTPYDGARLQGKVKATLVAGRVVFGEEAFAGRVA